MSAERQEVWQKAPTPPSDEPTAQATQPQQRGGSSLVGFIIGLVVGAAVALFITWMAWKVPLDNANAQLAQRDRMLEISQQREQKLRQALNAIRDALNTATSALEAGKTSGTTASPSSPSPTTR